MEWARRREDEKVLFDFVFVGVNDSTISLFNRIECDERIAVSKTRLFHIGKQNLHEIPHQLSSFFYQFKIFFKSYELLEKLAFHYNNITTILTIYINRSRFDNYEAQKILLIYVINSVLFRCEINTKGALDIEKFDLDH